MEYKINDSLLKTVIKLFSNLQNTGMSYNQMHYLITSLNNLQPIKEKKDDVKKDK